MILATREVSRLVREALQSAQLAGKLPEFEVDRLEARPSKHVEQGDYNVALMPFARPARMSPLQIAQIAVEFMPPSEIVAKAQAAAPGYVNLFLSESWLRAQVEAIYAENDDLYRLDIGQGKRAQVEFVSANPTAPLHIGRSRGAIVGDTMARLLEAAGYDVEREYYFNNAGAQMRNLGNSLRVRYLEALGHSVELTDEERQNFYQGEYLRDFARELVLEKGDAWVNEDYQVFKAYAEQKMFDMIKTTLNRVDIHHDVFFNENSLYDSGAIWEVLDELTRRGYIYKASKSAVSDDKDDDEEPGGKSEATWFRSSDFGDGKDRVLVRSNGEPTYTLPDIAYHKNKLDRGFDLLVNVLGADHNTQYQVVQAGLNALDLDASKLHVIIVQLVAILRAGEVVRMSSRKGDFETLDDLIDQTSADAVRYMLLARSSDTHLNFDLDLAIKKSNENPVYYIQYAHVRCAGIFREAAARGVQVKNPDMSLLGESELKFLRKVLELGEVIELAATTFEPHRIAFYALELANAFHPVFDNVRVLASDVDPAVAQARLHFFGAAQIVFRRVLRLMGMTAPEVM